MSPWKSIPGYPGYQASTDGRIRGKLVELSQRIYDNYHCVTVKINGTTRLARVHRLICLAYHGHAPKGRSLALYRDDDKSNNNKDNIYWGSGKDNMDDRRTNGNEPCYSGLSDADVRHIRKLYVRGDKNLGQTALADRYSVSQSTISEIVNYRLRKVA